MLRAAVSAIVLSLSLATLAIGQTTAPTTYPSTAPSTTPATVPSTTQAATQVGAMSDEELLTAIRQELGASFKQTEVSKYLLAHGLIEKYFVSTQKDRAILTPRLFSTGVDIDLLGKITRIRRGWQDLSPGTYFINQMFGSSQVKYFLGIPAGYSRVMPSPLVIALPAADPFLTNPPPDNVGVTKIYRDWVADEVARQHDAIVLIPLLNLDELYGPSRPGMNLVIQPMLHAAEMANIDPQRVYVMGHAMGGHAAWNLALHYPTYFAAIAPLPGAADADWQRLRLMNLRNVFPVVWDDSDDAANPVAASRSIVAAIRALKFDVDYTETKNLGHVPPTQVLEQVTQTMRSRLRDLYPKEVMLQSNKPEACFNRADWVQIYQELRPGPEQRLQIAHGTGPMIVNQNTASVKATIANNKITMTTDNVLLMRLYFNASMIDFKQAVSVKINGKERFEGFIKPSVEEMLKDQIFLGRGWRYYSAVLDLDLSALPTATTKPGK